MFLRISRGNISLNTFDELKKSLIVALTLIAIEFLTKKFSQFDHINIELNSNLIIVANSRRNTRILIISCFSHSLKLPHAIFHFPNRLEKITNNRLVLETNRVDCELHAFGNELLLTLSGLFTVRFAELLDCFDCSRYICRCEFRYLLYGTFSCWNTEILYTILKWTHTSLPVRL